MSCPSRSVDDDTIHAYVAGTLAEPDAEAFEQHLLGCAGCREEVRLGVGVRAALAARPAPRRTRTRALAAAAITLAAASVVWVAVFGSSRRDNATAAFTPPTFTGIAIRGPADADSARALADRGMAAYQRGDFAAAARFLDEASRRDASPGVNFYLAAALMTIGNDSAALSAARRASNPPGNPFAADAAIVAGKAWLRMRQPDSAIAELVRAPRDGPGSGHVAALLDSVRRGRP